MMQDPTETKRPSAPPHLFIRGVLVGAILGGLLALTCSRGKERPPGEKKPFDDLIVAQVGKEKIRPSDLDYKIRVQFPNMVELSGIDEVKQKYEVLRAMVDQYCWVHRGEQKGYHREAEFKGKLDLSRKFILSDYTVGKEVYERAQPTPEETKKYYEENSDQFTLAARCQAAMILVPTRSQAEKIRSRLLAGEDFGALARAHSTHVRSREGGGILGTVTHRSLLPGFEREELAVNTQVMQLQAGEISAPIETSRGWAIFRVDGRTEQAMQPLEEVQPSIEQRLIKKRANELFSNVLTEIKEETGATIDEEKWDEYTHSILGEEDLYQLALGEKRPERKISHYRALVERFPESPRSVQALFMLGFTYAEDLKDFGKARDVFQEVMTKYPENELVPSAQWMLENMEKGSKDPTMQEIKRKVKAGGAG